METDIVPDAEVGTALVSLFSCVMRPTRLVLGSIDRVRVGWL
jgi:hypothetical protein